MANTIILKRSATPSKIPTTGQLALGEIAINTYDGLIYIKKDNGTASVVQIGGVTSVNGETGSITISSDDVSDSGQTNKWFTNAQARSAISGSTGISYNSSTGAISTVQSIATSASPTFAGLTLTGNMGITGNIIPAANVTYDLGSLTYQWRDVYVGPGSLYVNGQKVLQDDSGTITFSADTDENIRIKTVGAGILQLGSSAQTGVIQVDSTLQITAGKNITDSAGIKVNFGDSIEMNGNKVIGLGAPSSANDAATKTYVDTSISAISTSSITQGNSNVTVTDTGTGTVTVSVDGSTALTVSANGVTVAGNLTVQGATTTVESNTISLADNILTLNSDATGAATQNAGLEVERGDDTNVSLRWNEGTDVWQFTNDGATYNPIAVNTDGLAEGSTNQYFTNTRARGALSGSSGTGISYSSGTGAFSLGSIPNSSLTNTTVTIGSTSTALGATSTSLAGLTSVTSTGFTGALTGNASTATALATARTIAMSGDVAWTSLAFDGSGSVSSAATLATVNTSVGTYGSSTLVPVITVNAKGLVTGVTTSSISGALTFTGDVTGSGATGASTALTIANSAVTNAKLANSSVTVGTTAIALGASSTTLAGLTSVTSTGFTGALTGNVTGNVTGTSGSTTGNAATVTNGVYTTDTGTVTSTMIADGTIVNGDISASAAIANSKLANSSVTVTAGTGMSGGGAVSLGGTITLSNTITQYTDALARAAVSAGTGISYNSSTGVITNSITNNNQLTNGAGYVTSSGVTAVTATGPVVSSGGATPVISMAAATASVDGYMTTAFASKLNGIASGATNVTNNNQLTNGSGYITGVTAGTGISVSGTTITNTITNNNQLTNGNGYYSSGSNVSFGTASTGALTVTGGITATGEITAYYSDDRLKKDVAPITDPIAKLMAIRGVTFRPNQTALDLGIVDKDEVGVIAQAVQSVLPQLVTGSAYEGYITVKYEKLTALLIEAVRAQQQQIDELTRLVNAGRGI
jgi:hypothetical protein